MLGRARPSRHQLHARRRGAVEPLTAPPPVVRRFSYRRRRGEGSEPAGFSEQNLRRLRRLGDRDTAQAPTASSQDGEGADLALLAAQREKMGKLCQITFKISNAG